MLALGLTACGNQEGSSMKAVAKIDISNLEAENGYLSLDSVVEDYDRVMISNPYTIDSDLAASKIKHRIKGMEMNDFYIVVFAKKDEAVVFAQAKGDKVGKYLRGYEYSETGKTYPKGTKFYPQGQDQPAE